MKEHDYETIAPGCHVSDNKLLQICNTFRKSPIGSLSVKQIMRLYWLADEPEEISLENLKLDGKEPTMCYFGTEYPDNNAIVLELLDRAERIRNNI